MTLLLDTHAFLWFWWADPLLSATASAVICDPANRKLVSSASSWEVAIKVSRKKLDMVHSAQGHSPARRLRRNVPDGAVERPDAARKSVACSSSGPPCRRTEVTGRAGTGEAQGRRMLTPDVVFRDPYPLELCAGRRGLSARAPR